MNGKLIKYLNKTRNDKNDHIRAILFSEETFTYYYLFDIDMENKKCVMMCEPINASRPYCELYSVYLEEIQYYIGPYQIVDGQSLGKPYKQVLKRLQKIEERLLSMSY